MSNRLTFSLASLILIFAFGLVAMPVMAADGGPTPTITEYSGLDQPNAAASGTNTAHEQERTDFRLLVTFDALVNSTVSVTDANFTINVAEGVGKAAAAPGSTGFDSSASTFITTGSNANKAYMAVFNLDTMDADYDYGYISFVFNADVVTGNQAGHSTNGIQNVRSAALELTDRIPKNNDWTVTAAIGTDGPDIKDGKFLVDAPSATPPVEGHFTVTLTFSSGTGDIPSLLSGADADQIQIQNEDGTAVETSEMTVAVAQSGLVATATYTVVAAVDAPVHVGINPNWANGNRLRIPALAPVTPPTPDPINPTVDISLVGMINEAANTFEVKFTFAEATVTGDDTAKAVPDMFTDANISITKEDPADPTMTVPSDAYVEGDIIGIGGGTSWLATINYRLDPLPLNVGLTGIPVSATTIEGMAPGMDEPGTLMVEMPAPANNAPVFSANAATSITGVVGTAITAADVSATDADNDTLTYSWDAAANEAALGLMLNTSTGMITGTPLKAHDMSHTVTVTDGEDSATHTIQVTITEMAIPDNNPPVVVIDTTAPTDAQTGSFTIEYTVTDADTDDTTFEVSATVDAVNAAGEAVTGYDVDTETAGEATIMQAKGSDAATVTVTITAEDDGGATGSAMLAVIFADLPPDPPDETPPTVRVIAPRAPDANGNLVFTFRFSEEIMASSFTTSDIQGEDYIVTVAPAIVATDAMKRTWEATVKATGVDDVTIVVNAGAVMDLAGNANTVGHFATYKPTEPTPDTTPPTVTISAAPNPINCETGSTLSFGYSETLAANEAVAASELTVSAGWKAMANANGGVDLVPMGDGSEIGVTTVSVSVNAGAVKDAAGNANAASAKATVFTVGPVLTIPAGGYIVVIRPEHMHTTHLGDPLYLGSTGVRAPIVDIQTWECMPDLTVFFGRSVPAIGGGAIVIKQADGPIGHTGADIAKGSVGLSEIMWASDAGIAHGGDSRFGRSNIDQTREQWIELHNRNNTAVKVTLFARPTNSALTTEADELDRVSNYNINNVWNAPGQSGNSELGIDFVSMQRGKHDNKGLAPTAAEGYAHGDWNGIHSNRWSASTISYLTRPAGLRNTGQLAADNLLYDFLGTPGRNNKPGVSTPLLRTNVPSDTIIFNEIANRRDQTLEWIELKNVSDAEVNLKKYQISLATKKGTDDAFYTFPDNDNIKLAAGEILLLLDTDPRDNDAHPIAVAFNRDGGNDQGLGIGPNAIKYKVANFREGGLPDEGNFVLYLRNRNDRLKSHEGVIDVIGWSDQLADAALHTSLWPLKVIPALHNNNKAANKIALETVHRRQHRIDPDETTHGDRKVEHLALRDVGYTGIGYKRHAQRIAAHGGTPGYEDTRKNLVADVKASGVLTISEIMYDQGDGQYPQWIEIYNSSDLPVNLHSEAGWRLVIENYDDPDLVGNDRLPIETLSGTLNFKNSEVQTILPGQTVMVTSTRARNSGSHGFFDTRVVFPATRVFSAWDDQQGELTRARDKGGHSTDPILSDRGFYIELIDGKGNLSDGVGNLVKSPNRRAAQEIVWELSEVVGGMKEADARTSILRRYRKPGNNARYSDAEILDMGIEAAGWISAHITNFLDVNKTWYGDEMDYGSPGITGGRVLPVELSKFRPERLDSGEIVIRWITQSELNNAGFNILRSEKSDAEFKQINTKLIAGQGTTSEKTTYEWKDTTAKPNVVYYYQIQDVSLDGKVQTLRMSRLKGNVSAEGKLTTTWGELKALQ